MDTSTEDEWEYIYDTSQTETITLTIDLSASPLGPSAAVTNQDGDKQQVDNPSSPDLIRNKSSGSVQFLDLPSSVPYISYKGQIFTGEWGETLGSDLIFASTSDIPDDTKPVMQSQDGKWCLLGVSQTTLVGKPVELTKRSRIQAQGLSTNGSSTLNPDGNELGASAQSKKPFTIVMPPDADPRHRKQATFLEQLMAIKMAKGEKDIVYLGKSAKYVDSSGCEKQGPLYSKRDWGVMNEDTTERSARRAKKTRIEDGNSGSEDSQGNQDEEDEVDFDDQDADANGNKDVEESRLENEETV